MRLGHIITIILLTLLIRSCTSIPILYGVGIGLIALLFLAVGLLMSEPEPAQQPKAESKPEEPMIPPVKQPIVAPEPMILPVEQPIVAVGPKASETPIVAKPMVPLTRTAPNIVLPCDTFVALDTETANSERGSVCAVAMTKVVNGKIVARYHSLIKPVPLLFSVTNQRLHGISAVTVRRAPTIAEAWNDIQSFMGDLPLVAHNIGFDKFAMERSLANCDLSVSLPMSCTMALAKKEGLPSGLKPLCERYGIPLDHHNATSDADACALCFLAMQELPFEIPKLETRKAKTSILTGKTIVFTGESDIYTRGELKRMAEQHGALVRTGVSGKTNYLVVGENPGESKLSKVESDYPNCEIVDMDFLLSIVA